MWAGPAPPAELFPLHKKDSAPGLQVRVVESQCPLHDMEETKISLVWLQSLQVTEGDSEIPELVGQLSSVQAPLAKMEKPWKGWKTGLLEKPESASSPSWALCVVWEEKKGPVARARLGQITQGQITHPVARPPERGKRPRHCLSLCASTRLPHGLQTQWINNKMVDAVE